MPIDNGVFGNEPCFEERFIKDYEKLSQWVENMRALHTGIRIVLSSGTFDMYHVGHARYIEQAKRQGDVLILGVDDDEKTRARKGPNRPMIPELERLELLAHCRSVDIVTLKSLKHEHWALIKCVRPDILVATLETYSDEEVIELRDTFGSEVVVLKPQAASSTSNQIRMLNLRFAETLKERLIADVPTLVDQAIEKATEATGKKPAS